MRDLALVQLGGGACTAIASGVSLVFPHPAVKAVAKVVAWVCGVVGLTGSGVSEMVNWALVHSNHPGVIIRVGVKTASTWTNPFRVKPYLDIDPWNN